jgi:formylglycine-generating enzyme required for sulfatase activity
MKIKRIFSALLAMAMLLLPEFSAWAQDAVSTQQASNTAPADELTNSILTLKQMMASNNIVTNTVGIVLVKTPTGLWAGKYEVTQDAYQKVMNANPSAFSGKDKPVDSVSWNDAVSFCRKLTEMEQSHHELPVGYAYSLPTQVQWQSLADNATLNDAVTSLPPNHHSSTETVGSLGANSLGLFDTRGNVMEWCLDPQDKPFRVLRGGAWDTFDEPSTRPEFIHYAPPEESKNDYGFRIILNN